MEQSLFSDRDLRRMILPLFFEQLLGMTVGLADTAIISFAGEAALSGATMGPVFITVIGQCMGAGDTSQAEREFRRLTRITLLFSAGWNLLIFALTPALMLLYPLEQETKRLVVVLVLIHNTFNAVAFPFADPVGRGLRAAGDVKFATLISLMTTLAIRLPFSFLLGLGLEFGVIGIAFAMCMDWSVRGVIYWRRFRGGRWKDFQVLADPVKK